MEERQRKDKEKADAIKERQIRLGHVPDPSKEEDDEAREESQ